MCWCGAPPAASAYSACSWWRPRATAADALQELHAELAAREIALWFAELRGPAKDALRRYGLVEAIGEERLYPTLGQAVRAHVEEHGVPWQDWEDLDRRP